ncbi:MULTISPECIES: FecCD family ABC transporter permease [Bacteria]
MSFRVAWRPLTIGLIIWIVVGTLSLVALGLGDLPLSVPQVVAALLGGQDGIVHTVVMEWRLPRVLAAVLFGAALGVSGAIFQSLTRNPLASPEIIGFEAGSYAGGILVIIAFGGGYLAVAGGALVGGFVSAVAIYLLAYRDGMHGFRLIIIGIGISAMASAFSSFLILRAKLEIAMVAAVWGAGSLNPVGWAQLIPTGLIVIVAFVALMTLTRSLHQLELGDDAARAFGVRVEPARLGLVACGVILVAVVTAAAGPIAFVALAAPQIARRLTRSPGVGLPGAAAMGALVLLGSDLVAQHALPTAIPVGLVTVIIGGAYLVWLLIHEARRRL